MVVASSVGEAHDVHDLPPETDPDPLYDPPLLVFVWAAWAAASTWIGDRTGLWVLVGATALLTGTALCRHHPPRPRPFIVDFGVILLFCANAIALGVLTVSTTTSGRVLIAGGAAALAALAVTGPAARHRHARSTDATGPLPATATSATATSSTASG